MGAQIDWMALARSAWAAREKAYAPYSKFAVGAALLSESGEVYTGCNVENISLGLTICAERSAVTMAIQAGCREFAGIAIVADTETPISPCGACRQFLAEFNPEMPILGVGRNGVTQSWRLSELLPSAFGGITKIGN
jgi:cytidine deaminase